MPNHSIDLNEFAGGGLAEQVNEEMQKVYENIRDLNTKPDAVRSVTIKITVKPDEDREVSKSEVTVKSSLAPRKGISTKIVIGRDKDGKVRGGELKSGVPGQMFIDGDGDVAKDTGEKVGEEDVPPAAQNVTQLKKKFQ